MSYDANSVDSESMLGSVRELGYRPSIVSSKTDLSGSKQLGALPELVSKALDEAGESGRLVFLDFHAPWCGACKKLEQTTLSDPYVQDALSNFVFLKIDTDEHPAIGKYFGVVGLPTLLIINQSGHTQYRHAGLVDAKPLAKVLRSLSPGLE